MLGPQGQQRRKKRGLVLSVLGGLERKGRVWLVRSENGGRRYRVRPYRQFPTCTCPDFKDTGGPCKHVFAVRAVITGATKPNEGESLDDLIKRIGKQHRQNHSATVPQNWPVYNTALVNEQEQFEALLFDLCGMIEDHPQKMGRRRIPLRDIVFAAAHKVFTKRAGRSVAKDRERLVQRGYLSKPIKYNTLFHYMKQPTLSALLKDLIAATSLPFQALENDFAVDSTGFTCSRFAQWSEKRNWTDEERKEHHWVKAHLMCGLRSMVVTAVEIHDAHKGDSDVLPSLVSTTLRHFPVRDILADKGYSSVENITFIEGINARPWIPFKEGHSGRSGGAWKRAFHLFSTQRDVFDAHYSGRWKIEAVISTIKQKFGNNVRSKKDVQMANEVYLKILCHNICRVNHFISEFRLRPDVFKQQQTKVVANPSYPLLV